MGRISQILLNYTVLQKWLLVRHQHHRSYRQARSADLPFRTGILVSNFGISSLQPP